MSAIVASVARKSRNFFAAGRFFALAFIPKAPLAPAGIQVSSGLSVAGSAWKLKVASLGAAVVIAAKVDDTETIPSASPFATRAVAFSYEVPSGVLWKQPAVFICSSFSSAIFHAELTKDALPAVWFLSKFLSFPWTSDAVSAKLMSWLFQAVCAPYEYAILPAAFAVPHSCKTSLQVFGAVTPSGVRAPSFKIPPIAPRDRGSTYRLPSTFVTEPIPWGIRLSSAKPDKSAR